MVLVVEARQAEEFSQAKEVLSGFPDHQRIRYADDIEIVTRYFNETAYQLEMDNLEAVYSAPGGAVILALENDIPVGGVCLKKLDDSYCEMKRLFVPIVHRRKGIGQALIQTLLVSARNRKFTHMRLDTGTFMIESHHLYEKMGFYRINPYYEVEERLRDGLYFMELEL